MKRLAILLPIWLIFCVLAGCTPEQARTPKAENGLMDLAGYDFAREAPLSLSGSWEVLKDNDAAQSNLKTYRLTVKLDGDSGTLGLYIPGSLGVEQAWINGSPMSTVPGIGIIGFFENTSAEAEFRISAGSINSDEILLGTREQILKRGVNKFGSDIFFIVAILFAGLYQFMLFCLRKMEKAYLFSSIFCIAAAIYTLSLPPKPMLLFFFPGMVYHTYYSISLASSIIANIFFIFYLNALYPGRIRAFMLKSVKALALVYTAVIILMNALDFWQPLNIVYYFYIVLFVFLSIYLFIILLRVQKENKDALFILGGFAILSATSAAFLLYNSFIAKGLQLNKVGWLFFVLIQAFILSRRSARAFKGVEELTDRLIRLDRLKDDFLINTAHELKTPLHGIIGIGESILENPQNPNSLPLIISSARRLTGLVDNILTFSRMKNRDVTLHKKPVSIWQVVDVVFAVMRPMAREKGITLINEISEDVPSVYADENSLFQVMYNLAGNAVKFTEKGEIRANAVLDENMLAVSVSDTGIGMSPDKLDSLFLPIEETGTYENSSDNGTGLGLAITKRLVEMQGGSISAQSSQDAGSTFTFKLPVTSQPAQNSQAGERAGKSAIAPEGTAVRSDAPAVNTKKNPYTILIADDEPVNLRVYADMLKAEGYALVTATGGTEVFRLLDDHVKPDLLILDVMMPRMSGYEVCRRLREKYSLYELPILLVTIKNRPEDILAGFEAGANDYLAKPFHERELKARISNQLDIKTALNRGIRAEMNFLHSQIKPHFLYNTLNAIISLVRTQPDKACELMLSLSSYLREIFGFEGTDGIVSLKRELDTVRAYLDIIVARFPDKIDVKYDLEPIEGVDVPHLILQPVVENAVKHGILPKNGPGSITIKADEKDGQVFISVADDGLGMDKEKTELLLSQKLKGAGIGVANVNRRMLAAYGHGLEIESKPGQGTCVTFIIPKRRETKDEGHFAG